LGPYFVTILSPNFNICMKINTIVSRYVFKELIPPFVISLLFFTFIFLMAKILDITNLVVNYGISIFTVFLMIIYTVPNFLVFVIPMSVMMTVLLTFLRMSSDNEIVALKAGGVSIYSLLVPVFAFCLIGSVLTSVMAVYGLPWGRLAVKELAFEIASSNLNIGLKERTFNDGFKGVMLYVNKINIKDNKLIDVFIEDQRTKNIVSTVVAPKGEVFSEPDKLAFHLRLYNGTINQVDLEDRSVHAINFDSYDISIDLKKTVEASKGSQKDKKEMSLTELRQYLSLADRKDSKYYSVLIEYHKKFSISFACFFLGFLAVPLGLLSSRAKRSFGLGLGLVFFLLYYLLLSAGNVFGEAGVYPPVVGMWVPNMVMGGIGLYLFKRAVNERPIQIAFFPDLMKRLAFRLKGGKAVSSGQ